MNGIEQLLTPQEYEFVKKVFLSPGGKIHDCFHFVDDGSEYGSSISLWRKPEELGLIRCVGGYKWEPVGLKMHLSRTPPPRRPLSSLTETEAREVYRLAFGRDSFGNMFGTNEEEDKFEIYDYESQERRWDITLWEGGRMSATITNYNKLSLYQCPPFAAAKVVRYLDSIGIEIG